MQTQYAASVASRKDGNLAHSLVWAMAETEDGARGAVQRSFQEDGQEVVSIILEPVPASPNQSGDAPNTPASVAGE